MIKEIKYTGFTATPSDYECPDGELDAAINLVPEEGELRATEEGVLVDNNLAEGDEVLFIHVVNDGDKHLIIRNGTSLYYRVLGGDTTKILIKQFDTNEMKVSATGNVLCVYSIGTMEHFFFYNGEYKPYNSADYDIGILFGIDVGTTPYTNSATIKAVLHQRLWGHVGTWSNVLKHTSNNLRQFEIPCYLPAGEIYRINPVYDTADKELLDDDWVFKVEVMFDGEITYNEHKTYFLYGIKPQFTSYAVDTSKANKAITKIRITEWDNGDGDDAPLTHIYIDKLEHVEEAGIITSWSYFDSFSYGEYRDDYICSSQVQNNGSFGFNSFEDTNNALYALVNSLVETATEQNKFALPFFVRYGFRTISGDIICVSPPILIEPSTGVAPAISATGITSMDDDTEWGGGTKDYPAVYKADIQAKVFHGELKYSVRDKQKLRDIIEQDTMIDSLVIAVSDPIYMFKQGATDDEINNETYILASGKEVSAYSIQGLLYAQEDGEQGFFVNLPQKGDYEKLLTSVSAFKIIKEIRAEEIEIGEDNVMTWTSVLNNESDAGKLSGLAGNTDLMPDNTENLSTYDATSVLTYNQREHWLGVNKTLYTGHALDEMCGFVGYTNEPVNYKLGVRLQDGTNNEIIIGRHTEQSQNRRWLYYPYLETTYMEIYHTYTQEGVTASYADKVVMKRHPLLNGAYHFSTGVTEIGTDDFYGLNDSVRRYQEGVDWVDLERKSVNDIGKNMLYVSHQANPILIDQRLRVGDGVLMAGAVNTKPISRGQYGIVPLFAFSTDGIWGVEVSSEGTYSARQPSSRDVLLNEKSITPIDNAVLFTSARGIMMLTSADKDAVCISKEIDTKHPFNFSDIGDKFVTFLRNYYAEEGIGDIVFVPFKSFLQDCRLVYDYVHQEIIAFNPNHSYAYVFSLEDKKWGMRLSNIVYALNAYPEAWVVMSDNTIVNLSGESESEEGEEGEESVVRGLLITRPLKLDAPNVLKTVDTIIQRGKFRKDSIKSILYGSRDLFHWHLVYSSQDHYLRGFRGTPYKYFRIALLCELKKDESLFGCTIQYTPRLTDQPR